MEYSIRRSHRAQLMRLTVYPGGSVVVTAPASISSTSIEHFVRQKMRWILKKVQIFSRMEPVRLTGRQEYRQYYPEAKRVLIDRIEYWNQQFGFSYGRVSVKNHQSIWGSCSRRGNINLNYRLVFLPQELREYVVVHELCHLAEHNHSSEFWNLVGQALPNYRLLRKELKRYSSRGIPTH